MRTDKDGNYIYNKGNEHYPLNKKDNGEFEIKTPSTEEELKELGGLVKKPHLNKKLNEIAA